MGTLEDVRKMFQDFLAPELSSIRTRLEGVEQGQAAIRADLKEFRTEMLRMLEKADDRIDARFKELFVALNLEARVRRIEENQRSASRPESQ